MVATFIMSLVTSPGVMPTAPCEFLHKEFMSLRTSRAAQWLRICLPMQGMWDRSLVRELRPHRLWGN